MEVLLFFLLGIVFTLCLFHGTININIHHTMEDITPKPTQEDLDAAYKKMQDPEPEIDKLYEVMGEVQDIMEGSDRLDVKEE